MTKKAKGVVSKKKAVKSKVDTKKPSTPKKSIYREDWKLAPRSEKMDARTKKWREEYSFVEALENKCTLTLYGCTKGEFGEELGLIALLMLNGIRHGKATKRKDKDEDGYYTVFTIFEFDKKYAEKIRTIEELYFTGQIQIDANLMSWSVTFLANRMK